MTVKVILWGDERLLKEAHQEDLRVGNTIYKKAQCDLVKRHYYYKHCSKRVSPFIFSLWKGREKIRG